MDSHAKLELVGGADPNTAIPEVISLFSKKVTIGRSTKVVDVVLDLTPTNTISRRHAEITRTPGRGEDGAFVIRDLASTNGVFVNGLKISEQPLQDGDMVQFGGAADIPVGTRFGGTGSHIRYRFVYEHAASGPKSRKRRQPTEFAANSPSARQRANTDEESSTPPKSGGTSGWLAPSPSRRGSKLHRADTANAVEALRSMSNVTRRRMGGSDAGEARLEPEAGVEGKATGRKGGSGATSGDGPQTLNPVSVGAKKGRASEAKAAKAKVTGRKRRGGAKSADAVEVENSASIEAGGGGKSETEAGIKRKTRGRSRGGEGHDGDAHGVVKSFSAVTEGGGASEAGDDIETEVTDGEVGRRATNGDTPEAMKPASDVTEGNRIAEEEVLEALRNANCGLCSELLLQANVLPCSHSFCKLCWTAYVEEKGTTCPHLSIDGCLRCPVCMRKFHSSERNARRCTSLDLLIASLVDKLTDPKERARWEARQEKAKQHQQQEQVGMAAVETPAQASTTMTGPLPDRGKPDAPKNSDSSLKNVSISAATGSARRPPPRPRGTPIAAIADGGATRGARSRSNGRADGESRLSQLPDGAVTAPEPTPVKCDGCNEVGHDLRECPHRSESAGGSSEEEKEEDVSDDGTYEDEDDDEDDDED